MGASNDAAQIQAKPCAPRRTDGMVRSHTAKVGTAHEGVHVTPEQQWQPVPRQS